jgi:hypothetical protein
MVRISLRHFTLQTHHNNLGPPGSEGPGPYSMGPVHPNVRPPHLQTAPVTSAASSTGPSPQPTQLQRPMSQLVHQVSHNINKVRTLLLRIWEVLVSNLGLESSYPD